MNQAKASTHPPSGYCLISPCRNEAEYMTLTLESVVKQSVTPAMWVIVDDGSTDDTPVILQNYAAQYDFIKVVTRQDRGFRAVGPGVIEAFYAGLESIDIENYEFICKLDLDLDLPPLYFETLITRMGENPRFGTCSGKAYFRDPQNPEQLVSEHCGDESSVGMTKFYRVTCFKQIGGFVRQVMWDGIDSHRCRLLGWISCSWDDEALRFIHLRPMGSSQKSIITGRIRHGFGQYFMGTTFVYMVAVAVNRCNKYPYVMGSLAMLWGYVKSALTGVKRIDDPDMRKLLSAYQWRALKVGKNKATEELNARQEKVWNPEKPGYDIPL